MKDKELPVTRVGGVIVTKVAPDVGNLSTRLEGGPAGARIDFIDTLRGLAVLLVLWDHLVGQYLTQRELSWWPHEVVHEYVSTPLGIVQDFGWFGVCLFFLISGYVITHVAQRESSGQFTIRRLLRIYPPLAGAILLAVILAPFSGEPVAGGWPEVLWGMTLLNYFGVPQNVVLGVAWTLVIEVLFYSLVAVQISWFERRPRISAFLNLSVCVLVIACSRRFGNEFFLFAASVAFIPYLIFGQILYLRSRRIVGNGFLTVAGLAAFATIQYGIREVHVSFLPLGNSYLLSFVFALGLFVIAMLINIKPARPILFSAQVSYSLYLVHGPVGFAALGLGTRLGLPYAVSLPFAIAAVFGMAFAFNRMIERPSQLIARQWTASTKLPSGGAKALPIQG